MLLAKSETTAALRRVVMSMVGLSLGCMLSAAAWADVWKYIDENGVTQFTNQPPNKNVQLVIQSDPGAPSALNVNTTPQAIDKAAQQTVAVMNASPTYLALQGQLAAASQSHGVDYALLRAVVATESAFNTKAVSPKGAVGLMQIMPATAQRYGVWSEPGAPIASKLTDPALNIQTGTQYLADLLRLYGGETELALAAYNAGEAAVLRAGKRIPNFRETQHYVKKVMAVYRVLQTG